MAILAGFFSILFSRFLSRWWASIAALLAIAAYTLLVGSGAAVVRAAVMSGLGLVAVQIGRSSGGVNALMFAAGVMCLINPNLPWDVSFQLSFAATLGLLLYASRLQGHLQVLAERRLPARGAGVFSGLVAENVLFTLIAQAFTLPIIIYHFGRISLVSPLANLLVLPAQSALMILSGAATLLGLLWLPLGRILAFPAWALAAYTLRVVSWLGRSPGAELAVAPGGFGWALLAYALLLSLALPTDWVKAHLPRLRPALVLLLLAGLAVFLWRQVLAGPDDRLHLIAYNLDGQLAVLVRAPRGQTVLLTGGESASRLSAALGRWLPPLGRGLDAVVVTGPQSAALKALPDVLAHFPPRAAFLGVDLPDSASSSDLQAALADRRLTPTRLEAGQSLDLGNGARLEVPVCSASGCALRLENGSFSALLPAGNLPDDLPREALHGLTAVLLGPQDAPEEWQGVGAVLALSPASIQPGGWAHIQTDGEQMWVEQSK